MDIARSCSPEDRVDETAGAGPDAHGSPHGAAGRRKISTADIQHVQNLIERCLQLYMPRQEVVVALQTQSRIDPSFTRLVWAKLEEQNPAFFEAYSLRLKIKDQIVMFNYLLGQQQQALQKLHTSWLLHNASGVLPATKMLGPTTMPMSAMLPTSAAAATATAGLTKQGPWTAGAMLPTPPQQQQQQQAPPTSNHDGTQAAMQQLTMQLQQQPFAAANPHFSQQVGVAAAALWPDFLASGDSSPSASAGSLPLGLTPTPPPYYANNQQPAPAAPQQREEQGLAGGGLARSGSFHAASPGFPKPFSFNDLHGLMPAMDDVAPHEMDYDSDNGGGMGQHEPGADDDMLMGGPLPQPTYSF